MSASRAFAVFDASFDVVAGTAWIERIETVFAALAHATTLPPTVRFEIVDDDSAEPTPETGRADLFIDGQPTLQSVRPFAILDRIVWEVNQLAWRSNPSRVLIHAGAVEVNGRATIVCGPSGAGKTTLTTALCVAGAGYLSDEIAVLDPASNWIDPYPKPLSLRAGSRDRFPMLAPPSPLATVMGSSWYVPLAGATSVELSVVAFVDHDDEGTTVLRRVPRAEALLRLCDQTPTFARQGAFAFSALAAAVRTANCVEVVANDLGLAVQLVLEEAGRS
jgi:hypothetical protein